MAVHIMIWNKHSCKRYLKILHCRESLGEMDKDIQVHQDSQDLREVLCPVREQGPADQRGRRCVEKGFKQSKKYSECFLRNQHEFVNQTGRMFIARTELTQCRSSFWLLSGRARTTWAPWWNGSSRAKRITRRSWPTRCGRWSRIRWCHGKCQHNCF